MNYEIQYKCTSYTDWCYWGFYRHLSNAREHAASLRKCHIDRKFRIVRVTRKVVRG